MISLSKKELSQINGGGLWEDYMKKVEDAGQYVGGFLYGFFTGECPKEC